MDRRENRGALTMTAPWNGRPPAPLDEVEGWHCFYDLDIGITYQRWRPKFGIWMTPSNKWMAPAEITNGEYYGVVLTPDQIAAQIAEAVKAEREACAEVCDGISDTAGTEWRDGLKSCQHTEGKMDAASLCCEMIRARGETA